MGFRLRLLALALPLAVPAFACGPKATTGAPPPASASGTPAASSSASGPPASASSFGPKAIDAAIRVEWGKAGLTPSPREDDARWLRRVTVDIVGTIPRAEDVLAFDADQAPDKRARWIDRLLASPQYADHWATYWDDVLMGQKVRPANVDRAVFVGWLEEQFAKNRPWNQLVYELVSATGQNSTGGPRFAGKMVPVTSATSAPEIDAESGKPINPAVNWLLKFETPQDAAGTASRTFLGVQIQCAQCHDHKTEAWKQTDFQKLASCFTRTQVLPVDKGKPMGNVRRVDVRDLAQPVPRFRGDPETKVIAESKPTALDGKELAVTPSARKALAEWLTAKDNPWFAQAIVNRMWGHFLGRGFIDPVDDVRPSNPTTMPELLKQIADDFVAHGYDLKHLMRTIANAEVYGLSSRGGETTKAGAPLWSRFRVTPLAPEELLASLLRATDLEATLKEQNVNLEPIRIQLSRQYGFLFEVDEELDRPSFEGTITQALTLINGSLTGAGAAALSGSSVHDVLQRQPNDAARIEQLYLRTLSRRPTAEETAFWTRFVSDAIAQKVKPAAPVRGAKPPPGDPLWRFEQKRAGAKADPRAVAFEDMFWALLNSSEFVFNH